MAGNSLEHIQQRIVDKSRILLLLANFVVHSLAPALKSFRRAGIFCQPFPIVLLLVNILLQMKSAHDIIEWVSDNVDGSLDQRRVVVRAMLLDLVQCLPPGTDDVAIFVEFRRQSIASETLHHETPRSVNVLFRTAVRRVTPAMRLGWDVPRGHPSLLQLTEERSVRTSFVDWVVRPFLICVAFHPVATRTGDVGHSLNESHGERRARIRKGHDPRYPRPLVVLFARILVVRHGLDKCW
mmetsp:Transcript_23308/g.55063  ORF Transcript_23308/g.55063 Transcript_23308/m.55063 type:complete len:239 (-) Transcript_23308:471-1187(-)